MKDNDFWWVMFASILLMVVVVIIFKQCNAREKCHAMGGRYVRSQEFGSLGECVHPVHR